MRLFGSAAAACAVTFIMLNPVTATAATPNDLSDLVGARAGQAEGQIEARGYYLADSRKGSENSYTYWWNASRKVCARVTTSDGRYAAIQSTGASDCNQKGGSDGTAAAVAIGAAALIGAIALSHKSHDHDDGNHYNDQNREGDYERGYRDGLYNQSYHNYSRTDAYSEGYAAGVRQRGYETSYRPGYYNGGGYGGYVNVNDLVGRSRIDGETELSRRGFVTTDSNKTDYDGRYTTWWRASSEQCITVNTRGGSVYSVNSVRPRNCK
ncbi:hypothetical protein [Sphingomonas cavernae]|uniref:17 kDa surface antigen n=1 Tax=Sphingomonas cavernae TaxID=2320861 RepID=A0A418W6P8_9SPHN|nr:hypothetical protein [Sphingomonas cavernae]RJF85692.1 hypothetical protein D3876_17490 [Sphingomonas cavernae]